MSDNEKANNPNGVELSEAARVNDRRTFLKYGGLGIAALALTQANNTTVFANPSPSQQQTTFDLGAGDIGILNFAYLLEQLEAEFYARVVAGSYYASANAEERQILQDLRDHEAIHRQFFRTALGSAAIPTLTNFDFSLVNFASRDSVLTISQILEDTGVSAYNGAGQFIQSAEYLLIAGKIVSVEARHASAIRDLRIPRTGYFSDSGADFAQDPITVLNLAAPFLPRTVTVTANNLPRTIVV